MVLALAVLHQWAKHSEECCQVRVEQQDQLLQQLQQVQRGSMSSVRSGCGHSTDWEAGVWLGGHAHCDKLAKVESIWDMVTDSTEDSGGTSACLLDPIPRSPGHGLLADGLSQHGCRQFCDDHLAGKERTGTTVGTR